MINYKRYIAGFVSVLSALCIGACAKSEILGKNAKEPVFETQTNIVLDWSQIREDAQEQFNDKTLYPMSGYIDMAFSEEEGRVTLIWSLSGEISDDEALAYGSEYIRAVNNYAADQDFSIKKSGEDSYGGLFDKYDLQVQLFREDDIMEESLYIVNQEIKAGSNAGLELYNKGN